MTKRKALAIDAASDQMFVRVPLPPELVTMIRKHVERAGGLLAMGRGVLELVNGTDDAARRFVGECVEAAADVERDAKRVRKALGRRRPRRRK